LHEYFQTLFLSEAELQLVIWSGIEFIASHHLRGNKI